jgi:biopolymer transport protein ExbD
MYRLPSRRKYKEKKNATLNLIPILDAVFIFIFFLLISASFLKIFEINSDIPIVSNKKPPPPKKKPLNLVLELNKSSIVIRSGSAASVIKRFKADKDNKFPIEEIHNFMVGLKQKHTHEKTIVFEPHREVSYEIIVEIMDAVRNLRKTDDVIFSKDSDGTSVREEELFSNIIFGNIMS